MSSSPVYYLHVPAKNALNVRFATEWQPIVLGPALHASATGGTATVYGLNQPASLARYALKLYNKDRLAEFQTPEYHRKLRIISTLATLGAGELQAFALSRPFVSWPLFLAYTQPVHASKNLAGFVTPYFRNAKSLAYYVNRRMRAKYYPKATDQHVAAVAGQIAYDLNQLHYNPPAYRTLSNITFGDLSLNNILVNRDTYQSYFLDADSYQYISNDRTNALASGHTTPEYRSRAAAIAQSKKQPTPLFTPNSDNEALAILIFHLLVDNNHPWRIQGTHGDLTPEECMVKGLYPYAKSHQHMAPEHAASLYRALPIAIQNAFTQAFTTATPPSAQNWSSLLSEYRRYL